MTRSLRIAVDARPLAFPNSGIGRYTLNLLRELALDTSGHEFLLYCDRPTAIPFSLPGNWRVRTGNVTRRALSTPFAQAVFPAWSLADRIDVFWSPRHHLPLALPPRVRKVLTVHDLVWKRFPETMARGGRLIESLLMPASLRLADSIIAVSQFTKDELAELFPAAKHKVRVIYEASTLPIDIAPMSAPANPRLKGRSYFLFVGSSEPRKNLPRLLDAYKAYRASASSPVDLVVAGSYQWGEFDTQHFIEQNNLGNHIHLLKELDDSALANLYRHASALLLPSLYEGFGLPLVEAMQWGVPIVTSRSSAMSEIAGDAALTVDPLDTHSIRSALSEIGENNELHTQLARNALTRTRQFDWHHSAAQTLDALCNNEIR